MPNKLKTLLLLLSLFFPAAATVLGALDADYRADVGVLDLREIDLESADRVFALGGAWEFVYGEHLEPVKDRRTQSWSPMEHILVEYVTVPSTWKQHSYQGESLPGTGVATYRLRVLLSERSPQSLALLIPAWETAHRLYVNGRPVARAGEAGTDRSGTLPQWQPITAVFPVEEDVLEIVVHVSNFDHARGGPAMMPWIGTVDAVRTVRERGVALRFLTFGSLTMIALYHGAVFLLRRKERSALFFGLFSLLMALRSLVVNEQAILLLFPELPWGFHVRFTYLTFVAAVPVFFLFISSLYKGETVVAINRVLIGVTTGYAVLIAVGPTKLFTALLSTFQGFMLAAALYCVFVLFRAVRRRKPEASLFLAAFLLFLGFVVNDVLYNQVLISTAYVVPLGVLVFVFLQAVILARHYSLAFIRAEELFQEKTRLEGTTLTLRSLTLLDALTGIANRRRFDEYLEQEWRRAVRSGTCIACIMIDIDFFKRFNDAHGHPAGDEALRKIARVLGRSVRRPADLVVRYGGEEFAALLPDTDPAGAFSRAEIIRNAVQELGIPREDVPPDHGNAAAVVTISLGCAAMVPESADMDPLTLVRRADEALYLAKERGRNRTEVDTGPGCP